MNLSKVLRRLLLCLALATLAAGVYAQALPTEDEYYKMVTLPTPEGVVLEVGGLALMPDGRLAVSTRRGEVWLVENPTMDGGAPPHFKRFAHGLHEALGLGFRPGPLPPPPPSGPPALNPT